MAANEEMLIRLQIRKPIGIDSRNEELKELREKSQNEYVQTVVNTMQMQVMSDVRVLLQEGERKVKAVPTSKFDPSYLEESIESVRKQVWQRLDRSEANTQDDIIALKKEVGEQRQQSMDRIIQETNLQH